MGVTVHKIHSSVQIDRVVSRFGTVSIWGGNCFLGMWGSRGSNWIERQTCNPRLWVRILAPAGIVHD